ncbi:MAG: Lrp/AsnC family transcriptional regulator [Thaumarchaeota archaeon]|nr:Lrp/AsnC family transcriptional regulator [Nitrososphaerota archaeon]
MDKTRQSALDAKDVEILGILTRSGRSSLAEIARESKLSDSTVQYRIDRLKRLGVIEKFTVQLRLEKLGYTVNVTIGMSVQPDYISRVADELAKVPWFYSVWIVSGAHNISCRGAFKSQAELSQALSYLHKLKGVKEYHLSILTQRKKDSIEISELSQSFKP